MIIYSDMGFCVNQMYSLYQFDLFINKNSYYVCIIKLDTAQTSY